jgi:hypothetical protein
MVGSDMFAGAADGGRTIDVGCEVADVWPHRLWAVTTTWMVPPTSADCSTYVLLFAPETLEHVELQRRHW